MFISNDNFDFEKTRKKIIFSRNKKTKHEREILIYQLLKNSQALFKTTLEKHKLSYFLSSATGVRKISQIFSDLLGNYFLVLTIYLSQKRYNDGCRLFLSMIEKIKPGFDYLFEKIEKFFPLIFEGGKKVRENYPSITLELLRILGCLIKFSIIFKKEKMQPIYLNYYLYIYKIIIDTFVTKIKEESAKNEYFCNDKYKFINHIQNLGLFQISLFSVWNYLPVTIAIGIDKYIINSFNFILNQKIISPEHYKNVYLVIKTCYNMALLQFVNNEINNAISSMELAKTICEKIKPCLILHLKLNKHYDPYENYLPENLNQYENALSTNRNSKSSNDSTFICQTPCKSTDRTIERASCYVSEDKYDYENNLTAKKAKNKKPVFSSCIKNRNIPLSYVNDNAIPRCISTTKKEKRESIYTKEIDKDNGTYYQYFYLSKKICLALCMLKFEMNDYTGAQSNIIECIKAFEILNTINVEEIKKEEENDNIHVNSEKENNLELNYINHFLEKINALTDKKGKMKLLKRSQSKYSRMNSRCITPLTKKLSLKNNEIKVIQNIKKYNNSLAFGEVKKFFIFLTKLSLYQIKVLNDFQPIHPYRNQLPIYIPNQFLDCLSREQRLDLDNIQTWNLIRNVILLDPNKEIILDNINIPFIIKNLNPIIVKKKTLFSKSDSDSEESFVQVLQFNQEIIDINPKYKKFIDKLIGDKEDSAYEENREWVEENLYFINKCLENIKDEKDLNDIFDNIFILKEVIEKYKNDDNSSDNHESGQLSFYDVEDSLMGINDTFNQILDSLDE